MLEHTIELAIDERSTLHATLGLPTPCRGLIIFARDAGLARGTAASRAVTSTLHQHGFAALGVDTLTGAEVYLEEKTGRFTRNVNLRAARLVSATVWAGNHAELAALPIAFLGFGVGAAAALIAAAEVPERVQAVVSHRGWLDLAIPRLDDVRAPTLLMGPRDGAEAELMRCRVTHWESVTRDMIEHIATLAAEWLQEHLLQEHLQGPRHGQVVVPEIHAASSSTPA